MRQVQQPGLDFGMRDGISGRQDMRDAQAPLGQTARHQQAAVTVERVGFRAHRGGPITPCPVDEPVESIPERFGCRHFLVIGYAAREHFRLLGPAAQLIAEKGVSDVVLAERSGQSLLVELRREPGDRRRPHIGDRRHTSIGEKRDETPARMVRMPNGENGRCLLAQAALVSVACCKSGGMASPVSI